MNSTASPNGRGHLCQFRGCAEKARHRRQDFAGRGATFIGDDGAFCRRARSARFIRAYQAIRISPITTGRRGAPRSNATVITSGDVGYIDEDGYVFICDRKRDMVISGDVNIYPAEIEAALHGIPGVHDCACSASPTMNLAKP